MAVYSLLGHGSGRAVAPSRENGRALCGQGCGVNLPAEMFAVTSVFYRWDSFFGNGLLKVDPKTLRPLQRHALHLGDAVTTPVPSPDGSQIALGGENMGEILFTDRSLRHLSRLTLVRHWQRHDGVWVDVEAWPRPSRLFAVATIENGPWWATHHAVLFVVNPVSRRILRRVPLNGTEGDAVSLRDGTTALIVDHGRNARVVVVTPHGSTWSRSLSGLDLLGGQGVRADGTRLLPQREIALATDGRNRVFLVATDRPIGELRIRERELRYHPVVLPRTYFSYPRPVPPGTGGVTLTFGAGADWFGHGQLAISSSDNLPVGPADGPLGSARNRYAIRDVEIVDTRTWHRVRTIHSSGCDQAGLVILCHENANAGGGVVAYDSSWHRLWANASSNFGWNVTAGRLLAWQIAEGRSPRELDPATGRVLRKIAPVVAQSDGDGLPTLVPLRPRR